MTDKQDKQEKHENHDKSKKPARTTTVPQPPDCNNPSSNSTNTNPPNPSSNPPQPSLIYINDALSSLLGPSLKSIAQEAHRLRRSAYDSNKLKTGPIMGFDNNDRIKEYLEGRVEEWRKGVVWEEYGVCLEPVRGKVIRGMDIDRKEGMEGEEERIEGKADRLERIERSEREIIEELKGEGEAKTQREQLLEAAVKGLSVLGKNRHMHFDNGSKLGNILASESIQALVKVNRRLIEITPKLGKRKARE